MIMWKEPAKALVLETTGDINALKSAGAIELFSITRFVDDLNKDELFFPRLGR